VPRVLLRPDKKVTPTDAQQQRVVRQLDEARFGRGHLLLPVDDVLPSGQNPRTAFDQQALNDLAESIKRWDQLQPIIVRRVGDQYRIVAGERRWRATRLAGRDRIWAVERNVTDADAFKLALIENLHRVDLSRSERVAALDQLSEYVDEAGLRATARELHVTHGWLCSQLKLRKDPVIFPALEAGQLSFAQAAELRLAPAHARRSLLDRTLRDRPTSLAVRGWVNEVKQNERGVRAKVDATLAAGMLTRTERARQLEVVLGDLLTVESVQDAHERHVVEEIASVCRRLLETPTLGAHQVSRTRRQAEATAR
jgi:ParB-like chromosome segregation protein Spo0J